MAIQTIIFRLLLAIIISGTIGYERQVKSRPAGLRTHILVCIGATVITLIQYQLTEEALLLVRNEPILANVVRADPARLTAQIISGIGFLGAGTIIVQNRNITGLTTAASLWAVAGLGIAVGMGYYTIAIIGCAMILVVLYLLKKIISIPSLKKVEVRFIHRKETKEFIAQYFEEKQIVVRDVNFSVDLNDDIRIYKNVYTIELPKTMNYTDLIEDISIHKNVTRIRVISV